MTREVKCSNEASNISRRHLETSRPELLEKAQDYFIFIHEPHLYIPKDLV